MTGTDRWHKEQDAHARSNARARLGEYPEPYVPKLPRPMRAWILVASFVLGFWAIAGAVWLVARILGWLP